ncbi:hypothetical protein Mal15_42420 [Stieleria maiorica]|uniref:Uncharacterized protein n=1 Tax=Stieleria maiorica TaxID=2795974 RepID=A0A5B9MFY1_9BACT|nr:hypothetical protein [Stieleria maiorica]QEG00173.1 hypothetical protein Mal15_42420 [Stieleria maiorica]
MGNRQKLIGVVVDAGMPRNGAEATLDCDSGMDALAIASEMSQRFRGAGVPCFVIDQKITLIGTQPTSVLVETGDPKLLSINLLMPRRYSKQMLRFVFPLVLQKQAPGSSGVASPA